MILVMVVLKPSPVAQLWQAFVGIGARRVEGYYNNLLNSESDIGISKASDASPLDDADDGPKRPHVGVPEKLKGQIEKVILCMNF